VTPARRPPLPLSIAVDVATAIGFAVLLKAAWWWLHV
jgi:hypothetical protein